MDLRSARPINKPLRQTRLSCLGMTCPRVRGEGSGDERIGERATLNADDAQMVLYIGSGLLQGERLDVVADVDALVEGLEALELEHIAQVGLAEEDEGKRRGGIQALQSNARH